MKSLKTLIRLQRSRVDELKRQISVLENQKAGHLRTLEDMAKELQREQELAGQYPEMGAFFGDFAGRIRRKREEIHERIRRLDQQADALTAKVHEVFSELKKLEIVRDRRQKAAEGEQRRKDTAQLDEVGLQTHVRRRRQRRKEETV